MPGSSLARERALWIVSEVFVRAFQLFLLTVVVFALASILEFWPTWNLELIFVTSILFLAMAVLLGWMMTYIGMIPWVHRTRYRLRCYEEATAQRGADVLMRSRDLEMIYRPQYFLYRWVPKNEIMFATRAKMLPARPERWLKPVDTTRGFPFL